MNGFYDQLVNEELPEEAKQATFKDFEFSNCSIEKFVRRMKLCGVDPSRISAIKHYLESRSGRTHEQDHPPTKHDG